jgi:hypothetical protein
LLIKQGEVMEQGNDKNDKLELVYGLEDKPPPME